MTKAELEKESEEYYETETPLIENITGFDFEREVIKAYQKGAEPRENRIEELEAQIEKMKAELHHRLVSPSHSDSDCLDKIVGLDRLWQFGQEF